MTLRNIIGATYGPHCGTYESTASEKKPDRKMKTDLGKTLLKIREKAIEEGMTLKEEDEIVSSCPCPSLPEGMVMVKKDDLKEAIVRMGDKCPFCGVAVESVSPLWDKAIALGIEKATELTRKDELLREAERLLDRWLLNEKNHDITQEETKDFLTTRGRAKINLGQAAEEEKGGQT